VSFFAVMGLAVALAMDALAVSIASGLYLRKVSARQFFRLSWHFGLFQAMIRKIMDFNVRIEIIGYWIYAFDSYGYRKELKDLGFWFSKKHKAWVFSGGKKLRTSTRLSTDEVRGIHGSEVIRDREAVLSIG